MFVSSIDLTGWGSAAGKKLTCDCRQFKLGFVLHCRHFGAFPFVASRCHLWQTLLGVA
jgi:hypothetical protein